MSILLSKIPEKLADKCLPFKFDYRVLEFSDKQGFTSEMGVELVETLQGNYFLFVDNPKWRDLNNSYDEAINLIENYLSEFNIQIDNINLFHFSSERIYKNDGRLNPFRIDLDFVNFLKHVGIYEN